MFSAGLRFPLLRHFPIDAARSLSGRSASKDILACGQGFPLRPRGGTRCPTLAVACGFKGEEVIRYS